MPSLAIDAGRIKALRVDVPGQAVAEFLLRLGVARLVERADKIGAAPGKIGQQLVELHVVGPVLGGQLDRFPSAVDIAVHHQHVGLFLGHLRLSATFFSASLSCCSRVASPLTARANSSCRSKISR